MHSGTTVFNNTANSVFVPPNATIGSIVVFNTTEENPYVPLTFNASAFNASALNATFNVTRFNEIRAQWGNATINITNDSTDSFIPSSNGTTNDTDIGPVNITDIAFNTTIRINPAANQGGALYLLGDQGFTATVAFGR